MIPQQWASPCGNKCTNKYSALTKIPCLEDCNQLCYKDPVLKDQQWSAYIDRSPGAVSYSEECFRACVSGCSYKFDVKPEEADKVSPNRQTMPETVAVQKPKPELVYPIDPPADIPGTSA
ncbi:uncharacterized protein LOC108339479 isoform X2 [Vigna angularis]|uniref:uncharacterized protein LOC108339479 isoform X2 n=1 Tax=Phaseolus angularis TaxID=3914 RepID=UPI000809C005|nr:uncharacterized protein LOC108339479 isoform X2 [Vigna angularis]